MEDALSAREIIKPESNPKPRPKVRNKSRSYDSGLLTVLPVAIAIGLLLVLPGFYTVFLSLYDGRLTTRGFTSLFADDLFWTSLYLAIGYSLITVTLQIVLGTCAAAVVHRLRSRIGLASMLIFLPYAVPSVVAVVIWKFLLQDRGVLAIALSTLLGVDSNIWMGNWIFVTLVVVSVWQFYPFVFVTLLARMRRIPPALYRSAQLDGASAWHQFQYVTFPAIRSTLLVVVILRFAFMFTKFDTPFLLGGATANEGIRTLPIYIYDHIGLGLVAKPGVAGAVIMALILLLLIGAVIAAQELTRKRLGEDDDCA